MRTVFDIISFLKYQWIYKHNFNRNLPKFSTFSYDKNIFKKWVICKDLIVQVLDFNPILKFKNSFCIRFHVKFF